jgi:hypothetical protein
MRWFHDLSISSKLLVAFLVVLGFSSFQGLFAIARMDAMRGASDEVSLERLPGIMLLADVTDRATSFRRAELLHCLARDESVQRDYERRMHDDFEKLEQSLARIESHSSSEGERRARGVQAPLEGLRGRSRQEHRTYAFTRLGMKAHLKQQHEGRGREAAAEKGRSVHATRLQPPG